MKEPLPYRVRKLGGNWWVLLWTGRSYDLISAPLSSARSAWRVIEHRERGIARERERSMGPLARALPRV